MSKPRWEQVGELPGLDELEVVPKEAAFCALCDRECDVNWDYCFGCGEHVCKVCDPRTLVSGFHELDAHELSDAEKASRRG